MRLQLFACMFTVCSTSVAHTYSSYDQCVLVEMQQAEDDQNAEAIRKKCLERTVEILAGPESEKEVERLQNRELGALSSRIVSERMREFDPYVIIPHRMNYVLPVYTTNQINTEPYSESEDVVQHYENIEAKFQLSLKVPLNPHNLLTQGDGIYFAFTVESWWQVYASDISKPFRETNYRPELFYLTPLPYTLFGGNTGMAVGIEHQSNGQSELLSRSWNRIYLTGLFEKDNFALLIRPWWRLPEKEDEYPGDPKGDDNPDISDYMGYFELSSAYTWDKLELNVMMRRNFHTGKGAAELGFIFPIWKRLRGYATVFSGYGDSMIDYNYAQTRVGLGIALTGFL